MAVRGGFGLRLALWYAGMFAGSAAILVWLTYTLLASSLQQRDYQIIESTLRVYETRYNAGGLGALARAVDIEERAGRTERLFVRVVGFGQDALFMSMPPAWGDFDVERLGPDADWTRAPARGRNATLEVASARLVDGAVLQVGKSTENRDALLERFRQIILLVSLAVTAAALAGGALLTRSTVQPIRNLAAVVHDIIATGRTSARVPDAGTGDALDELGSLFNAMLTRITSLIEAMRESLDNVAHDLRTPMARLRATAERALASNDTAAQRDALVGCIEECDRVLSMLNTLMDISEAETGTLRLSTDDVSLGTLVREVLDLYEDVAEQKGVALVSSSAEDVHLQGDRDRLRQVLANLVDNAVKYTPTGGTVRVESRADGTDAVMAVSDTGIGIPPEDQPRIFDRLYRGDRSRAERGLGLGLSLVRAYVTAHRGQVAVESQPGRGSTFIVRVPRRASSA